MSENFDAALARFEEFLKKNNWPTKVIWLSRDEVLLTGSRIAYLRAPAHEQNETEARRSFSLGIEQGRGVWIKALVAIAGASYSTIWVPTSDSEAEYALMSGVVKLSVPTGEYKVGGRMVRSRLRWFLLGLRYRGQERLRSQFFDM